LKNIAIVFELHTNGIEEMGAVEVGIKRE